jgi:hypothetical protein
MISIARFAELGKMADKAAKKGDLATIATINKDEELRSGNMQFVVRGKVCYITELSTLDRTTVESVQQ